MLKKPFTITRSGRTPDFAFRFEPAGLSVPVDDCKRARRALARVSYDLCGSDNAITAFGRSLYVLKDTTERDTLSRENVRSIRTGHGTPPRYLAEVLGKCAAGPLACGTALKSEMIR